MAFPLRSTHGVDVLIDHACANLERTRLAEILSPLFPDDSPWSALADIPAPITLRHSSRLSVVARELARYRAGLTCTAGRLARYLDASEEDIRDLALHYAKFQLPGTQKLRWAARLLGTTIPGQSVVSRLARVNDARFWRRTIRSRLLREREHFYLRLGLIGKRTEIYVSDQQLVTRRAQLRRQERWMRETVLLPRFPIPDDDKREPLTLADVAAGPSERFAKLYTFVNAMDAIAQSEHLSTGMLTLTLEPVWHPNPSVGQCSWNGASPREAHQCMGRRWQSVLRDLDRIGIGLSGLRVVEPHADACPHWHIWMLYRPEAETTILSTVMRYFPNRLKVRAGGSRARSSMATDLMFDTRDALLRGLGRPPAYSREGAQVELSRIDRDISSGASYAMKYLLKTVDAGGELSQKVGLFSESGDEQQQLKRKRHQETARRVDAFRALWGINAGQLFGVAKCLTAWDELRRLQKAPESPELRKLWGLARGTDQEGRIPAGANQRGDAQGFIRALGGLAACGKPAQNAVSHSIGRMTEAGVNVYGEPIVRTRGVTLIERKPQKVERERVNKITGEITARLIWRTVKTIVAEVRTRLVEWMLVPKDVAKRQTARRAGLDLGPS